MGLVQTRFAMHTLEEELELSFISGFCFVSFCFAFCLFRATPVARGSSQARGQVGAAAAVLHHSHSNAGSEPRLQPIPQLTPTLDL